MTIVPTIVASTNRWSGRLHRSRDSVRVLQDIRTKAGPFSGHGVLVNVVDTGQSRTGHRPTHGDMVSAVVAAVAPRATIARLPVGRDPSAALDEALRQGRLTVAAWEWVRAGDAHVCGIGHLLTVAPRADSWPARLGGPSVRPGSWPGGPFPLGASVRFSGLSASVALAAGVAALLVESGMAPERAAAAVAERGLASLAHLPAFSLPPSR